MPQVLLTFLPIYQWPCLLQVSHMLTNLEKDALCLVPYPQLVLIFHVLFQFL